MPSKVDELRDIIAERMNERDAALARAENLQDALDGAYEELNWAVECRVEHTPDCITWPFGSRWSDEHPCDCGYDAHTEHIQRLLNKYHDDLATTPVPTEEPLEFHGNNPECAGHKEEN